MKWKLYFVYSSQGLGIGKSRLFLVEQLETWDFLVNLSCKLSGHLPLRFCVS